MKKKLSVAVMTLLVSASSLVAQETTSTPAAHEPSAEESSAEESATDVPPALNFTMKSIDGKEVNLAKYKGNVVVIVNTASKCGMTPQYKQLQELHEKYGDQGVKVLGFPCNQFGRQEPGSEEDIKAFCTKNYGVTFDMFSKIDVNGDEAAPLFKYLKSKETQLKGTGDVRWNFEKFILDKSGNPVARFSSRVRPDSEEFMKVVENAMED
jgi:glutathione peroxidase